MRNLACLVMTAWLLASCGTGTLIALIPPAGVDDDHALQIDHGCKAEAAALRNTPLTAEESARLAKGLPGVETCRFWHYGSGSTPYCDHFALCLLDHNFQPVGYPNHFFPNSKCEILKLYQEGGIEKERLRYMCDTKSREENCEACLPFR